MANTECRMNMCTRHRSRGNLPGKRSGTAFHSPIAIHHSAFAIRRRSAAGLSLVEILIALFVFLIGILGILAMFPVAMDSAGRAIGEVRANVLAQAALAQLTSDCRLPYETGGVDATAPPSPQEELKRAKSTTDWSGYYVTVRIDVPDPDPDTWQCRLITGIDSTDETILKVYPPWTSFSVGAWTWTAPTPNDQYVITRLGLPDPPDRRFPTTKPAYFREGFVRMFKAGTTDTFHAGVATGPAADDLIAPIDSAYDPDGAGPLQAWDSDYAWSLTSGDTAAGGGTDYLDRTISTPLPVNWYANCRLALTENAGAGQLRWISADKDVTATEHRLYVTPDWDTGQEPDGTTQYAILPPYYLLITSGRAAGRLYVITADKVDDTNGHEITCAGANFADDGVTQAYGGGDPTDPNNFLRVRATQFAILGNSKSVRTILPLQTPRSTFSGTATGGSPSSLIDSGQSWPEHMFQYWRVRLTNGTGAGQLRQITDNTADTLNVSPNWTVDPTFGTRYEILPPDPFTGTATAGGSNTLEDSTQVWPKDLLRHCRILLVDGTGRAQIRQITANTNVQLTVKPDWTTPPSTDTEYAITALNTFGIPTALQTAADVYLYGGLEQETSAYSVACVFTDDPSLRPDQVRVDVFVFRNFDQNQDLPSNRRAVGFVTGFIERP